MISIDATLAMFRELDRLQLEIWDLLVPATLGRIAASRERKKLNAFFAVGRAGDFIPVPTGAPSIDKEEWIADHKAKTFDPRTVYAVQAGTRGDEEVVVVYTNRLESNTLDLWLRLTVGERDGALKVLGQETRCGDCDGVGCSDCGHVGWRRVGDKMKKFRARETRKLVEPEDPGAKIAYESLG